jgi:hypothetical protein
MEADWPFDAPQDAEVICLGRILLGSWLHYPTGLEVNDVCEALQVRLHKISGLEGPNTRLAMMM